MAPVYQCIDRVPQVVFIPLAVLGSLDLDGALLDS